MRECIERAIDDDDDFNIKRIKSEKYAHKKNAKWNEITAILLFTNGFFSMLVSLFYLFCLFDSWRYCKNKLKKIFFFNTFLLLAAMYFAKINYIFVCTTCIFHHFHSTFFIVQFCSVFVTFPSIIPPKTYTKWHVLFVYIRFTFFAALSAILYFEWEKKANEEMKNILSCVTISKHVKYKTDKQFWKDREWERMKNAMIPVTVCCWLWVADVQSFTLFSMFHLICSVFYVRITYIWSTCIYWFDIHITHISVARQ